MRQKILEVIVSAVVDLNQDLGDPKLENPGPDTTLYAGSNGTVDSLGLVTLIADVESRISTEFSRQITLTDERAMSQERTPFRSIETLADYVEQLLSAR